MIKVFYHIYSSTHRILGLSFVDQQLRKIYVSRLHDFAELNCVVHGPYHNEIVDLLQRYKQWRILENQADDPEDLRELRTLRYVWQETNHDDAVLYFNTKGITYASGQRRVNGLTLPRNLKAITSWRWAMEHYNIERWVERFNHLRGQNSHTTGCFLMSTPYLQYAGNFWWANGSHIRHLPHPTHTLNMTSSEAARRWLFTHIPNGHCDFNILDCPRDSGTYQQGSFRLHEDDCWPYVMQDQHRLPWPPLGPNALS